MLLHFHCRRRKCSVWPLMGGREHEEDFPWFLQTLPICPPYDLAVYPCEITVITLAMSTNMGWVLSPSNKCLNEGWSWAPPDTGGHTTLGSCGRMGAEEVSRPVRRLLQLTKQEMMKNWTVDIERRGITVDIKNRPLIGSGGWRWWERQGWLQVTDLSNVWIMAAFIEMSDRKVVLEGKLRSTVLGI